MVRAIVTIIQIISDTSHILRKLYSLRQLDSCWTMKGELLWAAVDVFSVCAGHYIVELTHS